MTRWIRACDKRLRRLICYIHHTGDHSLESCVGDDAQDCHPVLFSDADFAGDLVTAKSSSGCYFAIVGPNAFAPTTASCKMQTCVSHSSTESEIAVVEQGIRMEGLQALTFCGVVTELLRTDRPHDDKAEMQAKAKPSAIELDPYSEGFNHGRYFAYTRKSRHTTVLIIAEDNEAAIKIVQKARSMALRHLPRTHRIDVQWLFEVCANPRVRMLYVNTKQQVAGLMTKALNNPVTWEHLMDIAQIRGGIQSAAGSALALLAAPPGLALPFGAARCPQCAFDITIKDAQCLCTWD